MYQHRRKRNTRLMWVLIGAALIYGALVYFFHTLTGRTLLDGTIGVVLGLYICSRPAANAIDLFYERDALRQLTSGWSGLGWLVLNLLVLFAGWVVIVIGATRFAGRTG
jgi:D-alanyl-lipoteichoic acid acyltransferase DltB (MBOAT superfamily)